MDVQPHTTRMSRTVDRRVGAILDALDAEVLRRHKRP